jgi:hypothetical protein
MPFNLPPEAPAPPIEQSPLPSELKVLVDDSVKRFKEKLGMFAGVGSYVSDYQKEIERVAFCAYRAGFWKQTIQDIPPGGALDGKPE